MNAYRSLSRRVRRRLRISRACSRIEGLENRRLLSVTNVFELDGNATTAATHDWDQVFADNNVNPPPVSGAAVSSFVTDKVNSNADDIFTGGGSKDTLGIQQGRWLFTGSKPQAKDDITHAMSARTVRTSSLTCDRLRMGTSTIRAGRHW
jgi:hypothetical protein